MKKLLSYRFAKVNMLLAIILNIGAYAARYEDAGFGDILTIAVCVFFLAALTARHKAGIDEPMLGYYAVFLLYLAAARLAYAIFPLGRTGRGADRPGGNYGRGFGLSAVQGTKKGQALTRKWGTRTR